MRGRNANTLQAYAADYEHFGGFCAVPPARAVEELFAGSHGEANARLHEYQASMVDAGLSPATINRRIAAIKSLATIARTYGLSDWTPEIRGLKSQSYRDTAGPGLDGSRALLKAAKDQAVGYDLVRDAGAVQFAKAARDVAIVRMLFDMGLRRGELASLDLEHLDLDARKVSIMGKGKRERIPVTIPIETTKALRDWLDSRATVCLSFDKHVFCGLSGPKFGKRLSGHGVWDVITDLGRKVGIKVAPHGLRHASITAVLDATNGDARTAQRFARHSNIATTIRYDDNREDLGGRASERVASILSGE